MKGKNCWKEMAKLSWKELIFYPLFAGVVVLICYVIFINFLSESVAFPLSTGISIGVALVMRGVIKKLHRFDSKCLK